jgi:DHA1 family bicyclomycin/chloramphenicol resistance-like MFS transporter
MATNTINARLVRRFVSDRQLTRGTALAAVAVIALAVAAWTDWGGLWGLAVPLFLFVSATGFVVANSIAGHARRLPRACRRCVGAGRCNPIGERHYRLRAGRRLR